MFRFFLPDVLFSLSHLPQRHKKHRPPNRCARNDHNHPASVPWIKAYRVSERFRKQFPEHYVVRKFTGFDADYIAEWVYPEDRELLKGVSDQTDDCIHRCPYIMGHIGQKKILGIVCKGRFVQRRFQQLLLLHFTDHLFIHIPVSENDRGMQPDGYCPSGTDEHTAKGGGEEYYIIVGYFQSESWSSCSLDVEIMSR